MTLRDRIRKLAPGLTIIEAAKRIGMPYATARRRLIKYHYRHQDGRRFSQNAHRKIRLENIDWKLSNVEIARKLLCSRERIRVIRKKFGKRKVGSRGRKNR